MEEENIQPKIKEILIANKRPKAKGVFCETAIYHPENFEEAKLGRLLVLGRLKSSSSAPSHVLNILTSTIKKEYYSSPKRSPIKSLEEALKKANGSLVDLTKTNKVDWLDKFSFICVALAKNNLYLTNVGQTKILLLRDGRITDIGKKLVPIQDKVNPQKAFQSVASGKIYLNDKIVLTTADIFKFIPQKGFRQILEHNQIEHLEKLLNEDEDFSAQGMLIIGIVPEEKILVKTHETITLSPSLLPNAPKPLPIKEKISAAAAIKAKAIYSEALFLLKSYYFKIKDKIKTARKEASFKKGKFTLASPPEKKVARTNPSQETAISSFENKGKNKLSDEKFSLANFRQKFSRFSITEANQIPALKEINKKRILLAALIMIVAIAAFGVLANQKYKNDTKELNALILQEEKKASQAQKIISLESPEILADFENRESKPEKIILIKDNILSIGKSSGYFYLTPLADPQNTKAVPAGLPSKEWLSAEALNENALILQDNENNLFQYNISQQEINQLPIKFSDSPVQIKDFALYNETLYLLGKDSSQIFKCADFSSCSKWNRGEIISSAPLSMAIDGSVYIISSDKILDKYFGGAKEKSYFIKLSSKLSNAKIKTAKDFKNIYLVDKQNNRLAIISKNGELVRQYASPQFKNLKDFQVSNDEKTAYVLDNEKIYLVALE